LDYKDIKTSHPPCLKYFFEFSLDHGELPGQAQVLVNFIKSKLTELEALKAPDNSNVDRMLENSIKLATLVQYSRTWDKSADFALYYELEVMPPEVRWLEIFLADLAELTGSWGVTSMTVASVTHFYTLEGFDSPFTFPRFGKIMLGIKASYGKAAKPKRTFTTDNIAGSCGRPGRGC
jgi:hypothetical protein